METLDFNPTFTSEYGWQISLPLGWERLEEIERRGNGFGNKPHPVVFACEQSNWELSLTWMASAVAPSEDWWNRYEVLTMVHGAVDRVESEELCNSVFPLIGKVCEANSIALPDGNHALEIIEAIRVGETTAAGRYGYQLLMPMWSEHRGRPYVQRLVFYADKTRFMRSIEEVKASARSLRSSSF